MGAQMATHSRLYWGRVLAALALLCGAASGQSGRQAAQSLLAKSEALEAAEAHYAAREVLREAAGTIPDEGLLERLAALDDASGNGASDDYMRLAKLLDGAGRREEYLRVLRRGLEVSIRDGDSGRSAWFQARLEDAGERTGRLWVGEGGKKTGYGVWVPGGLDALAYVAGSAENSPPERFFADYCRTIRRSTASGDKKLIEAYVTPIREHFRIVKALEELGTRKERTVTIVLSLADAAARRRTKNVASRLGWDLRAGKKGVSVAAGLKEAQARRQDTASALGVDEASAEEALGQGKPYAIEIRDEWAPLVVDEAVWRKTFYAAADYPGGMAEAVAVEPRLATVYAGMARMDGAAAEAVVSGVGLKKLAEKNPELFYQAAEALAVEDGRALAPGGTQADTVWRELSGADPREAARFFEVLFEKDGGNLLEFYATLAQLDGAHQRFFTANAARAEAFYRVQRETPQYALRRGRGFGRGPFVEFLRSVPLDEAGRVRFPGGPEVWMAAKGGGEDEILLRLARTRYAARGEKGISELDTFRAVARVDAHRTKPLDAASARLLAQWYGEAGAVYPYFAALTGLELADFQEFFRLAAKIRGWRGKGWNEELGEVHSLIKLLCLLEEAGRLSERQAAEEFSSICRRYVAADSAERMAEAGLKSVREILASAGAGERPPDEALREMLLGKPETVTVMLDGRAWEINPVKQRYEEYDAVLEEQKTPRIGPLMRIADSAVQLKTGVAGAMAEIERAAEALISAVAPDDSKDTGRKEAPEFEADKLRDTVARLRRTVGEKRPDSAGMNKLCRELVAEVAPLVKDALAGVVYAYYFRPDDLLVSEDPLLVRKHRFTPVSPMEKKMEFPATEFEIRGGERGSYFQGGFAGFSEAAGLAAASGRGGLAAQTFLGMELAAIRATPWQRLRDRDLRLAALRIRVGREWIVEAAEKPEVKTALEEATQGLLSQARRSDLVNAIGRRDWGSAWGAVTVGDLYHLGEAALKEGSTAGWGSPVVQAAREEMARGPHRMDLLGGTLRGVYGCDHPHLVLAAPYEEYEHEARPEDLAERAAEFKLYLAAFAAREGMPAAAMETLAEPLVRRLMGRMDLTDAHDWRAALESLNRLNDGAVEAVLDKP
jgi:hypothetical protein